MLRDFYLQGTMPEWMKMLLEIIKNNRVGNGQEAGTIACVELASGEQQERVVVDDVNGGMVRLVHRLLYACRVNARTDHSKAIRRAVELNNLEMVEVLAPFSTATANEHEILFRSITNRNLKFSKSSSVWKGSIYTLVVARC